MLQSSAPNIILNMSIYVHKMQGPSNHVCLDWVDPPLKCPDRDIFPQKFEIFTTKMSYYQDISLQNIGIENLTVAGWARIFKMKSRPKKLVKSNKSISRNFILTKFHFLQFQKWLKINF